MKRVFTSASDVIHLWAQRKQSDARSGNVFFEDNGTILYSYGYHFPMAKFVRPLLKSYNKEVVVLLTTRTYSVTTARHISWTRHAIDYDKYQVIDVPYINATGADHAVNLKVLCDNIERDCRKTLRARTRKSFYESSLENALLYSKLFKVSKKPITKLMPLIEKTREKILVIHENDRIATEKRDAQYKKERAEYAKRNEENKNKWLQGENVQYRNVWGTTILLRLVNRNESDRVETSQGAHIPLQHAIRLFRARKHFLQTGNNSIIENWRSVGHFTVDTLFPNGDIKAGCHLLKNDIINAFVQDNITIFEG